MSKRTIDERIAELQRKKTRELDLSMARLSAQAVRSHVGKRDFVAARREIGELVRLLDKLDPPEAAA